MGTARPKLPFSAATEEGSTALASSVTVTLHQPIFIVRRWPLQLCGASTVAV